MYFDCQYRVSYGDTDQMGVVYYANYLELFERGRTEMLRAAGMSYKEMEKRGIVFPVIEAFCKYHSSAHYDDLLTLRSYVGEIGRVKVKICCEVYREDTLLVSGHVVLGSINWDKRPQKLPQDFLDILHKYTLETSNEQ
jgi:acyl-CoA thioester hydrolase